MTRPESDRASAGNREIRRRGSGVFDAVAGPAEALSGSRDTFRGMKAFRLTVFIGLLSVLVWMAIL